jgi:hypothetical protein
MTHTHTGNISPIRQNKKLNPIVKSQINGVIISKTNSHKPDRNNPDPISPIDDKVITTPPSSPPK